MKKRTIILLQIILIRFLVVGFGLLVRVQSLANAGRNLTNNPQPTTHNPLVSTPVNAETKLPPTFRNRQNNRIDNADALISLLNDSSASAKSGGLKIMMIGDSHVRGNIFPQTLRDSLSKVWTIDFTYISKNGVRLDYFLESSQMNRIIAFKPDLLIVSVGTNEAHSNFNADEYLTLMKDFVDKVYQGTDSATVLLFTTPPGSHISTTRKAPNGTPRTIKIANPTTKIVADTQKVFCNENNIPLWNLYDIAGNTSAPRNWRIANMMRTDAIHFTANGYVLQATLLAEALIGLANNQ